ncbi:MAG: chorismate mutase [Cyanobacteria bacterium]|nr:chorismate mutase [Cyanobacteriota bacterium]MDA1246366.1 chorismate mutase [Cyanobacteriota bacterium]
MNSGLVLRALRGATTAEVNSAEAIQACVSELVDTLMERNELQGDQLVSVTFSVTRDLDACFPAAIARSQPGWDQVALLDCQQMEVARDLPRCIRLLAHVWLKPNQAPVHPYLREAACLRPDRAQP